MKNREIPKFRDSELERKYRKIVPLLERIKKKNSK